MAIPGICCNREEQNHAISEKFNKWEKQHVVGVFMKSEIATTWLKQGQSLN